ncbi:MAG: hypothetical protein M0040_00125 [Actinomycetota bacterium]|nr:hypothetical protein [Actinomycetota bacterium]
MRASYGCTARRCISGRAGRPRHLFFRWMPAGAASLARQELGGDVG